MENELTLIGVNAGHIWKELSKHGSQTIAALKKSQNLSEMDVQRAIGWLAREDKIYFDKKGKTTIVALR